MASFGQGALIQQHSDIQASSSDVQLVIESKTWQRVLGDVAQTIILPDCTQMKTGRSFVFHNMSKGMIIIKFFDGKFAASVLPKCYKELCLYSSVTSSGVWAINEFVVDTPLSIFASRPSDGFLNIASSKQKNPDGSYDTTSPMDFTLKIFQGCRIDFQAIPWTATGGIYDLDGIFPLTNVLTEGETFVRPSQIDVPVGKYVRMVLAYKSFENKLDVKFSSAANSQEDLTDAGILSSYIKGDPIGHVDFKAISRVVGVNTYYMLETVGSETGLIENGSIVRYKKDGGGFVSKLNDLSVVAITGNLITIEGGSITLADGRVLSSYENSDADKDINDYEATLVYDMTDDLLNLAGPNYHLYLDIITLPQAPDTITGTAQEVYPLLNTNFRMLSDPPELVVSLNRYIPISSIYSLGGGEFSFVNHPPKRHEVALGADGSLEFSVPYTVLGSVGSADQIKAGHELSSTSFPPNYLTSTLFYNLNSLPADFVNSGGVTFDGTGILGISSSCAKFVAASSQYLHSNLDFFNSSPGAGQRNFSVGGWFKSNDWFDHDFTLFSNWVTTTSEKWILGIDSAGNKLKLCATSTGPTAESLEILLPSDFSGWHYFAVLYFKETNTFHVYVDNVVYVKQLSGELITEAIQLFTIGHNDELILFGGGYLDGFVDEVFYCKDYTFEEDEIRKTYSYIIEHDRYLPSDSQEWIFWLDSFGGKKQVDSRIVDSDERYAWYDILGYKDTDLVSIKLYNANHTGVSKPAKPRTLELTTDALDVILALPLEHRLGVVPEVSLKKKVSIDPEFYEYLNAGDYFVASTTHLKLKTGITSLVDELGSGEVVILNYSTASAAHFVPNRFWNTYLVSSDTAVLANDYVLSNTASGIVYLTLPPNPKMGDMVIVGDARNYFGFNSCNINRNGKLINGKSDSYFECDISGKEYVFTYTDATYGWAVYF